jgi:hypothetical protein
VVVVATYYAYEHLHLLPTTEPFHTRSVSCKTHTMPLNASAVFVVVAHTYIHTYIHAPPYRRHLKENTEKKRDIHRNGKKQPAFHSSNP